MEKTKTIMALEHALNRLNDLPHKYNNTDFKLIESSLINEYEKYDVPMEKRVIYLRHLKENRNE